MNRSTFASPQLVPGYAPFDCSLMSRRFFKGLLRFRFLQRLWVITGVSVATFPVTASLPAHALVVFTVKQVDDTVVVATSGKFSTSGLSLPGEVQGVQFPSIAPEKSGLLTGVADSSILLWDATFTGNPGTPFGSGGPKSGATTSLTPGPVFGFNVFDGLVYTNSPLIDDVDLGKDCLDPLNICTISLARSTTVFGGESYSTLGLLPGTYYWSWGASDLQKIQLDILPVPGPLPVLGASAAFAWSRRLRRRVRAGQVTRPAASRV